MTHPTATVTPELVRSRDAAKMLAVGERTLWRLTNEGRIPAVRFGRTVRYAIADIRALIEAAKQPVAVAQ